MCYKAYFLTPRENKMLAYIILYKGQEQEETLQKERFFPFSPYMDSRKCLKQGIADESRDCFHAFFCFHCFQK